MVGLYDVQGWRGLASYVHEGYEGKGEWTMKTKVLWATKIGDADWMEQVITEHTERIESASAWAKANGFDRLRVAEIDLGVAPSFGANMLRKGK